MGNTTYNYGNCETCDTPLEEQYIKQDFWIRGELIIIDHILAGVCPKCGEKIVNAETGQYIDELLKNNEYIISAPRISVPIIMFDEFKKRYDISNERSAYID
ncbi:MAG: YgiT-type zinc finger protein [Desulfobacterales bacterium]|nr:YgiT-type zinc finger protein [Desulfobacterales bacterium]